MRNKFPRNLLGPSAADATGATRHPRRGWGPAILSLWLGGMLWTVAGAADAPAPTPELPDEDAYHLPPPAPYAPGSSAQPLAAWPLDQAPPERLPVGIAAATEYLLANLHPAGRFAYIRFLPEFEREPEAFTPVSPAPGKYNMLRHAGAIYALGQTRDRAAGRPGGEALIREIEEASVRAVRFLHPFIKAVPAKRPDGQPVYAIWSPPREILDLSGPDESAADADPDADGDVDEDEDGGSGGGQRAKLGGAGLSLLAMTAVERFAPGTTPRGYLRGLGRFIEHMQQPNGSFHSILDEHGQPERFNSLYYPGEAILGLLALHDIDPDPRWLQSASWGMGYLARSRAGRLVVPPDHWALIATRELLRRYSYLPRDSKGRRPVDRTMLRRHAAQVTANILADQVYAPKRSDRHGAFNVDGALTPGSTRSEGLLAALAVLDPAESPDPRRDPGDPAEGAEVLAEYAELRGRIREALTLGVSFIMRHQALAGPLRGGMPRASSTLPWPAPPPDAADDETLADWRRRMNRVRKFNRRVWEVRVDYVQHALSAFIGYEELLAAESAAAGTP